MKKITASLIAAAAGNLLCAQPIIDIGLFPSTANDTVLEVRLCPSTDFGGVLSALVFTIQWIPVDSQYIGARVNTCPSGIPIAVIGIDTGDVYIRKTYTAFGGSLLEEEGCPLTACTEHVVMLIPIGYAVDLAAFQLFPEDYFVSLNSQDATGVIYVEPCQSTGLSGTPAPSPHLFPNPVDDVLNLTIPSINGAEAIEIMDASGRVVLRERAIGSMKVDTRPLANGTYSARITSPRQGGTSMGRFVVTHP